VRLSTAVARFVSFKRAQGFHYECTSLLLRRFARAMGNCFVNELTPSRIAAFLNSRKTLPHTRYCTYHMLFVFFRFLKQIDELKRWPMPMRPPQPRTTCVPFIYSRAEIRRILNQEYSKCFSRSTLIAPETLRTIVVFLYGTGVSLSEALTLCWNRVDFGKQTVEVCLREGGKTRTIPIGPDVYKLLRRYVASGCTSQRENDYVFVTRTGAAVNGWSLRKNFRCLCRAAAVTRPGEGHSEPRLQDLRYTFAVHRIESWYKTGADIQKVIPALAMYMGRVGLRSTERLLSLTPEHFTHQKSQEMWKNPSSTMRKQT
jgi:integrase/recombinase XerD